MTVEATNGALKAMISGSEAVIWNFMASFSTLMAMI